MSIHIYIYLLNFIVAVLALFSPTSSAEGSADTFLYSLRGYIKADLIYDVHGKGADSVDYQSIPVNSREESENQGHLRMHVKESRLGLVLKRLDSSDQSRAFIEMDFYGDGLTSSPGSERITNSIKPRLRHGYFEVGNWLVGQTWSNYIETESFPENLDLSNDTGQSFIRQPQIRYVLSGHKLSFSMSLENPESDFSEVSSNQNVQVKDSSPDITGKIKYQNEGLLLAVHGVYREIGAFSKGVAVSEVGYGRGMSGVIHLHSATQLRFHYSEGLGIGRYIQEIAGNSAIVVSQPTPRLYTQFASGGYIGVQQRFGSRLRGNLNGGYTKLDLANTAKQWPELNEAVNSFYSAHINLIWLWRQKTEVGFEYSSARIGRVDGLSGSAVRTQVSLKYVF